MTEFLLSALASRRVGFIPQSSYLASAVFQFEIGASHTDTDFARTAMPVLIPDAGEEATDSFRECLGLVLLHIVTGAGYLDNRRIR